MPRGVALAIVFLLLLILILVAWQPRLVANPPVRQSETLESVLHPPPAGVLELHVAAVAFGRVIDRRVRLFDHSVVLNPLRWAF